MIIKCSSCKQRYFIHTDLDIITWIDMADCKMNNKGVMLKKCPRCSKLHNQVWEYLKEVLKCEICGEETTQSMCFECSRSLEFEMYGDTELEDFDRYR